jgi:DNA repair ATPase RecN
MKMAEEEMKSFLNASVARPRAVEAYSKRLTQVLAVAKKHKIPAADLALLSTTAKDLHSLASQAKSYKPDNSKIRDEIRAELEKEYAAKFEKLETKLGEVVKAFSEAPKPIAR